MDAFLSDDDKYILNAVIPIKYDHNSSGVTVHAPIPILNDDEDTVENPQLLQPHEIKKKPLEVSDVSDMDTRSSCHTNQRFITELSPDCSPSPKRQRLSIHLDSDTNDSTVVFGNIMRNDEGVCPDNVRRKLFMGLDNTEQTGSKPNHLDESMIESAAENVIETGSSDIKMGESVASSVMVKSAIGVNLFIPVELAIRDGSTQLAVDDGSTKLALDNGSVIEVSSNTEVGSNTALTPDTVVHQSPILAQGLATLVEVADSSGFKTTVVVSTPANLMDYLVGLWCKEDFESHKNVFKTINQKFLID